MWWPKAPKGLRGNRIAFPKVSVGATHAALMAATLARGDTIIENAAQEPEIGDVAECLVKMGAQIEGIHSSDPQNHRCHALHGAEHTVIADRIETGTYAMAAAMTGGDVMLQGARTDTLDSMLDMSCRGGYRREAAPMTACRC